MGLDLHDPWDPERDLFPLCFTWGVHIDHTNMRQSALPNVFARIFSLCLSNGHISTVCCTDIMDFLNENYQLYKSGANNGFVLYSKSARDYGICNYSV